MALLEADGHIVARLKARCPSATGGVFSTADLAGVKEGAQKNAAMHVVLHSYSPPANDGEGTSVWQEIYLVVIVVNNARQHVGSEAIRQAAVLPLKEALAALDGWRCPGTIGSMSAINPPNPMITDAFGYFPLAFAVKCVTEGCNDPID